MQQVTAIDTRQPLLAVEGLTVAVLGETGAHVVVDDVSFRIAKGEYFALVGESGSGKSVTCHALIRLLPFPADVRGRVTVDGADVWSLGRARLRQFRRHSIGMIFQDPLAALNPVRTIGAQLIETLQLHHPDDSRATLADRAVAALSRVHVPQPELRLAAYPHQLSGGLNQRVVIALALMGDPPLLIADEPTTALDMSVQAEILDLLDELRRDSGLSVLMVTHDLGIVADRANTIAVMKSGRIVETGSKAEVLGQPRHPYTRALFEAARVSREAAPAAQGDASLCLSFRNVYKRFHIPGGRRSGPARDVVAAEDVSFTVREREVVALVGESGSGKTTAAKMALGIEKQDTGEIVVPGGSRSRAIQMVFQHPKDSLDPLMRVRSQLHEVLSVHGVKDAAERDARIKSVIAEVGLPAAVLDRRPSFLSGGEAQRVVIARALLLQPRLLIADEPLSAVDVSLQKQIIACFRNLREHLGIAILLITHDLRIVSEIADRVVVMRHGKVVEAVEIEDFFDGRRDPYTQKLIDAIPGRSLDEIPLDAPMLRTGVAQ